MIYITLILLALVIFMAIKNKQNTAKIQPEQVSDEVKPEELKNLPYAKKFLLTKNEWAFYKSLKPIADELKLTVLAKVRLADLVEVNVSDKKEYIKYFNKINKKHVDFILAKPENLQIELLIELDDNSHNEKQKERDSFTEALYNKTGYKLLRVRGAQELKEKITEKLGIKPAENAEKQDC